MSLWFSVDLKLFLHSYMDIFGVQVKERSRNDVASSEDYPKYCNSFGPL